MEVVDLHLVHFVLDFSPLPLAYSMILKELFLVFGGLLAHSQNRDDTLWSYQLP